MGFLTDQFGCRAVSVGGVLLALLGTLPFLWMIQNQFSQTLLVIGLFARGAGKAQLVFHPWRRPTLLHKDKLAVGTTAINIVQRLGGPMATTAMAIVMSLSPTYFPVSGPAHS